MSEITTIGLDLAKNVFQVHGIDETGQWWCASGCAAARSLHFLPDCRRV